MVFFKSVQAEKFSHSTVTFLLRIPGHFSPHADGNVTRVIRVNIFTRFYCTGKNESQAQAEGCSSVFFHRGVSLKQRLRGGITTDNLP